MRDLVYILTALMFLSLSLEANSKQQPKIPKKVKKIHCDNINLDYFDNTKDFEMKLGDVTITMRLITEIGKCKKGESISYNNKELGKCSDKGFYVTIKTMDRETHGAWETARTLDKDPINAKRFENLAIKINEARTLKAYEHYNKIFNEYCSIIEFD